MDKIIGKMLAIAKLSKACFQSRKAIEFAYFSPNIVQPIPEINKPEQ
jgi:hypothetical protein